MRVVKDAVDAEILRRIRNSCRLFMTRHCDEISSQQQREWWANLNHDINWAYLLCEQGMPAGYGLIRWVEGEPWLTGGLLPEFRDRGLGRHLFTRLKEMAGPVSYLEVRTDNDRAHALYCSLGFRELKQDSKIITMRYQDDPTLQGAHRRERSHASGRNPR